MDIKIKQLTDLQIKIPQPQNWTGRELDDLFDSIHILINILGGAEVFIKQLGEIIIERTNTGTSLGLAYPGRIKFNLNAPISAWTILHEIAHTWDAKNDWKLSGALEKFTGGFANKKLSVLKRFFPSSWDAGKLGPQNKPGFYGRKPGCNAAGYFYGDKPSGSNWSFNRREDFAESVVMYCGWGRANELSKTTHGRIERYLLPNGTKDPLYSIADNWSDYAQFFYPEHGDYSTTKRWQFIDALIQDKIQIK